MDILFTPWRLPYLTGEGSKAADGCLFCGLPALGDAEALIVHRGAFVYALLNRYPYSNGHLMLAPYAHRATLGEMTRDERRELLDLAALAEEILTADLRPHGFNLGLNLGRSAGAGVPGHAHLHVVPRWEGDTSFMTVVGGTRTVPEELGATRGRPGRGLHGARGAAGGDHLTASRGRVLAALFLALLVPGLGQAFLGRPRRGAAFFAIVLATLLAGLGLDRRPGAATAEAGTAFLLTAALMQLLIILDTFDRATGRKG